MSQYLLHVNHPNDKARIHVQNGCASARKALRRIQAGSPYGSVHGDRNDYWEPYTSMQEAEAAQERTGKKCVTMRIVLEVTASKSKNLSRKRLRYSRPDTTPLTGTGHNFLSAVRKNIFIFPSITKETALLILAILGVEPD